MFSFPCLYTWRRRAEWSTVMAWLPYPNASKKWWIIGHHIIEILGLTSKSENSVIPKSSLPNHFCSKSANSMKFLSQKSRIYNFNFIFLQMKFLSGKILQFEIVRNTVTIRIYESLPGKVNKSAKVPFQPLSSSSLIS